MLRWEYKFRLTVNAKIACLSNTGPNVRKNFRRWLGNSDANKQSTSRGHCQLLQFETQQGISIQNHRCQRSRNKWTKSGVSVPHHARYETEIPICSNNMVALFFFNWSNNTWDQWIFSCYICNLLILEVEKKPFYQQWWFLVIVALTGVILIIIVISLLCLTGRRKAVKYKGKSSIVKLICNVLLDMHSVCISSHMRKSVLLWWAIHIYLFIGERIPNVARNLAENSHRSLWRCNFLTIHKIQFGYELLLNVSCWNVEGGYWDFVRISYLNFLGRKACARNCVKIQRNNIQQLNNLKKNSQTIFSEFVDAIPKTTIHLSNHVDDSQTHIDEDIGFSTIDARSSQRRSHRKPPRVTPLPPYTR